MSIATLNRKTKEKLNVLSAGRKQFSINGSYRNQGWVGQLSLSRSSYVNTTDAIYDIIKPSVVNTSMAVRQKKYDNDHLLYQKRFK